MITEFQHDPGVEHKKLLAFQTSLDDIPPHGLLHHKYKSDELIAEPFLENTRLPTLDRLAYQQVVPFLIRELGLAVGFIRDSTQVQNREGITREMILQHWELRAARPGIEAILSSRYTKTANHAALMKESEAFVDFVLLYAQCYVSGKHVVEFGSGVGRFTLPLSRVAGSLTAVDMCADMTPKLKATLGDRWERIQFFECFLEDFPVPDRPFDCAFSCLIFIHILSKDSFDKAIRRFKRVANTLVICEHMETAKASQVSNFTRLWPLSAYTDALKHDFNLVVERTYRLFDDELTLVIYQRKVLREHISEEAHRILQGANKTDVESFPEEWRKWYHIFELSDITSPYIPLMSSFVQGEYEFRRDQTKVLLTPNENYELPSGIRPEEASLTRAVIEDIQRKNLYVPINEQKTRVDRIQVCQINPIGGLPRCLEISLRPVSYYHYLIVKNLLNDPSSSFRYNETAFRPAYLGQIAHFSTSNVGGCGLFVITRDNYVILSVRKVVAEYPGEISYSASGSMSWYYPKSTEIEANPFRTIMREAHEELGVSLDISDLVLFGIGIDIRAFFVQFSFYVRTRMLAHEVIRAWQFAKTKYEQVPFAVQWEPGAIVAMLRRYPFEPSASASLLQLATKIFGYDTVEHYASTQSMTKAEQ